ncbi:MAG TPA: Ig-like domain-containing protein, partial [Candidatus Saccharimonadales bacterium]|nr:Ig-like domain-containing protein [Candidatus Saccharimonadales bacterium]
NTIFPDSPNVGLTKDWITIQANMFDQTNGFFFSSDLWAFNKTNLYAAGPARFTHFRDTNAVIAANAAVPTVHYDTFSTTNYLVANWNGNPGDGQGYLRLFTISGPVGSEVFNDFSSAGGGFVASGSSGNPAWDDPWENFNPVSGNLAPQAGTTNRIFIGDARVQNVVYRNGQLWCAHHIFLPADAPRRCAVQWWAFTPGGSLTQRGRVDDPLGSRFFAYPSIAVNAYEDVLLGYSRFAADQFPSANYSYHAAESGPGSLFGDVVIKAGEASFSALDSDRVNHWGDWSATVVDPANDADLWTLQEYASARVSGIDRWGTWWGRVSPASSLSLSAGSITNAVPIGSDLAYSFVVTNQLPRVATGVRVLSTLPAGSVLVSSTGGCALTNGVVTCSFGDLAEGDAASATLVVRLNQLGPATNTLVASSLGAEVDSSDNRVQMITTVQAAADLAVSMSGPPAAVTLGSNVTYTVTVTNRGPAGTAGVRLTNTLPAGAAYLSAVPTQGSCVQNAGVVVCDLGTLPALAAARVVIQGRPAQAGSITNTATAIGAVGDPVLTNNTAAVIARVNAPPSVQSIVDRAVSEDTVLGPLPFTVGDAETPAASLNVTVSSSDPSIVPPAGLALGVQPGTGGAGRTLTVTPALNANGPVTITLIVTDADGASSSSPFVLRVLEVNDPPTIGPIGEQVMNEDTTLTPISFTVGDVETPVASLQVSGASSNPVLIPNANLRFGGIGTNRTLTLTPATNQSGRATITVSLSDGMAVTT